MRSALILGGGGPIGIAWEAGLLLGMCDRGLDLGRFDRVVGTSAGAIVGTHLTVSGSLEALYAAQFTPLDLQMQPPNATALMAAFAKAKLFHRSVEAQRRSLGKSAREAALPGEQQWVSTIESFLPAGEGRASDWPERELLITAVDVDSGDLISWTRHAGLPLAMAVASSCAVPCIYPLVTALGRTYMDGGMGSPANASLGQGFDQVVVADPLAHLLGSGSPVRKEEAALRKLGAAVASFAFAPSIVKLVGMRLMDATHRAQVAELAREQGRHSAATHQLIEQLA